MVRGSGGEGSVESPEEVGRGEERGGQFGKSSEKGSGKTPGDQGEEGNETQEVPGLQKAPIGALEGCAEEDNRKRPEEAKEDKEGGNEGRLVDTEKEEEENEDDLYNQFEDAATDEDEGQENPSGEVRAERDPLYGKRGASQLCRRAGDVPVLVFIER